MSNFYQTLKHNYKNKYKRCLISTEDINTRIKVFRKILDLNVEMENKEKNYKIRSVIITKDFLQKSLTTKKTLREREVLLKLYKKINYSLKLKKKYNSN